jgi:Biotin carboxyl carrier protein
MEEARIRKYADLMGELGLSGLEINENGVTVRLERNESTPQTAQKAVVSPNSTERPDAGVIEVCSPMVGVFYRAPTENTEPFVQIGDTVHKGDVLCIIEAMKLMNEIVAEQSGTVTEICAGEGAVVDFGRVLFRLREEQK